MFDITRAQLALADILTTHEDLLSDARGFGLRLAAIPRGLMPVKEAQQVVVDMGKNVEKLDKFFRGLMGVPDVPPDFAKDFDALYKKTRAAQEKCNADLKRAQEALAKHEDLLVGEMFQEMFEAVRIAIVEFDVADDVDLDFDTTLYLDKDPSYAVGTVHVKKGTTELYTVSVGYRAVDDFFYGNITSPRKYKTYQNVVKKTGRAKLPAFVRELTEQLKALTEVDASGVFKSRKKVTLTLEDTADVAARLKPALVEVLKKQVLWGDRWVVSLTLPSVAAGEGNISVSFDWGKPVDAKALPGTMRSFEPSKAFLSKPFKVTTAKGDAWTVTPSVVRWEWQVKMNGWQETRYPTPEALLAALKKNEVTNPQGPSFTANVRYTATRIPKAEKSAVERVADAFLSRRAGGTGFGVYQPGKDVRRAFRDAVDNAQHERGHGGYTGTIAEKSEYKVRRDTPFVWNGRWPMPAEMRDFLDKDGDGGPCDDKWGPACAVPVSEEKVLAKDDVTVTVEAKDEVEARKKGILLIKATGRIPPKATILVEVPDGTKGTTLVSKGARISTWSVKGLRKQSLVGEITGWYFYGWASS